MIIESPMTSMHSIHIPFPPKKNGFLAAPSVKGLAKKPLFPL